MLTEFLFPESADVCSENGRLVLIQEIKAYKETKMLNRRRPWLDKIHLTLNRRLFHLMK